MFGLVLHDSGLIPEESAQFCADSSVFLVFTVLEAAFSCGVKSIPDSCENIAATRQKVKKILDELIINY